MARIPIVRLLSRFSLFSFPNVFDGLFHKLTSETNRNNLPNQVKEILVALIITPLASLFYGKVPAPSCASLSREHSPAVAPVMGSSLKM